MTKNKLELEIELDELRRDAENGVITNEEFVLRHRDIMAQLNNQKGRMDVF